MIPTKLSLTGFLSHKSTEIDFTGIQMGVVTGANGAGKSSLIDAILFAVFGEGRAKGLSDFVNHDSDNAKVELTFILEGKTYRIIRQRNTANGGKTILGFDILDGNTWRTIAGNGSSETQKKIDSVLNMTYNTMINSSILTQGNADLFSKGDPAERKAVLGKILSLDSYEVAAVKCREKGREIKSGIEAVKMQVTSKENEVLSKDDVQVAIEKAKDDVSMHEVNIHLRETELAQLRSSKEDMAKIETELKSNGMRRSELQSDLSALMSEILAHEGRIKSLEDALGQSDTIKANAAKYEAMRAEYDAMGELRNQYAELTNKILQAQNNAGALQTKRDRNVRDAETKYLQSIQFLKDGRDKIQLRMNAAKSLADELDAVPCKGTDLQPKCKLLEKAVAAKNDLVDLQKSYAAQEIMIVNAPLGDEAKAFEDARVELQAENPHQGECDNLQRQRDMLNFDANSYSKLGQEVEVYAKYPSMVSKLDLLAQGLDQKRKSLTEKQTARKGAELKSESLFKEKNALNEKLVDYAGLRELLESTETALGLARTALTSESGILARLEEKLHRVGEIEKEIVTLQKSIETDESNLSLYADMATMFGKNGVQAMLIERAIPAIEAEANMLLGKLTDGLSISLETQRATGKGTISETLDILINDESGSKRYEMFSGGEKFRIDFSLRIALSKLLTHRAGAQIRSLVIDEGMGCLDEESLGKLLECLQVVQCDYDLCLVISHLEDVKQASIFPTMISVTKDEGGSHVEIIQN